jgi:hypothetical protein
MFEPFSGGYYLGRLYLEPHDGEETVIHVDHHEQVRSQLYAGGRPPAVPVAPLVMKVGGAHLPVHGQQGVPESTLGIPWELVEELRVDPPELTEVLLAKADRAVQLLALGGSDRLGE